MSEGEAMEEDVALVAISDQLCAFARDEGRRAAAYHQALRDGGVPARLAATLTEAWLQKTLWPCDGCRAEDDE
jgi:hypothetical protein